MSEELKEMYSGLDKQVEGEPVDCDNQGIPPNKPANSIDWEAVVCAIGFMGFIIPYLIVSIRVYDWVKFWGAPSIFLTYFGCLIAPFCSAWVRIHSNMRLVFAMILLGLGLVLISMFLAYGSSDPTLGLAIASVVFGAITFFIAMATYVYINRHK